ncbi:pimeloyl-ACP methyl ester carboxylesterase [Shimia isoporae]|uniref:Pimeloyl-ACP methyl ester carboxylesterase n=1 Tax=Shimia isoporae TaxID=647720 RepID=A0A4R1NKG2_9RHOB|nr:alpha/beta hydrolase [Shimia isoporae]TCL08714.1 pimeloyl-ACP methyl ester carboxylesterase [Shimia isoporae]
MPRFTTSDGLSLFFEDTGGDGPVVLCLAGLTRNSTDFDYALPAMTAARVIRLDYRGRGQSDWAEDFMSYSVDREARDAIELLDHLRIEKAAVLGTSRGGLIAMHLGQIAPQRLNGVCFNDVGPVIETDGLEIILVFIGRNPVWKTLDEAAEAFATRIPGFDGVPPSRWRQEVTKHFVETPDGLAINYDPKLRNATLATFDPRAEQPDLWPLFDALKGMPLAVIRGANSDILSAQTYSEMLNRGPILAAEIPDRGHVLFLDEPDAVAILQSWIDQLESPS